MIPLLIVLAALVLLFGAYGITHLTNRRHNRTLNADGFLYNQREAPAKELRYGFFSAGYNGCGWIAVYNACRILGEIVHPSGIISDFERYGAILFGLFGTWTGAVTHYFRKRGCRVNATRKRERMDALAKAAPVSILWFWHRKGAHFIALRPSEQGFIGYNVFSNSKKAVLLGASVQEFLEKRNYHAPRLIAVKKEASEHDERATA